MRYDVSSLKAYRQALGILGMALPIADLLFGVVFCAGYTRSGFGSISATHYDPQYLLFEGLVVAVGMFLIFYRGHDIKDFWISTVAGTGALVLSFFPCDIYDEAATWNFIMAPMAVTSKFHYFGALVFFLALFWIVEFQFTKTRKADFPTKMKRLRNRVYRICGWVMLGGLAVGFLGGKVISWGHWIYFGEFVALEAFGVAWLVKGEAIGSLNDEAVV
jgi:hypothetical protein